MNLKNDFLLIFKNGGSSNEVWREVLSCFSGWVVTKFVFNNVTPLTKSLVVSSIILSFLVNNGSYSSS